MDLLEQSPAPDQVQPGSNLENPEGQAASDVGPVRNKQSDADSSDICSGVVQTVMGDFFGTESGTESGKREGRLHQCKRKWQPFEDPDPLTEKKVLKTSTNCQVTVDNSWVNLARPGCQKKSSIF